MVDAGAPLVGGLDDAVFWNRPSPDAAMLEEVFDELNINSLVLCRPAEPYGSIVELLSRQASDGVILPRDAETRTFLHDLPVAGERSSRAICDALRRRKSVILPGGEVVTFGTVSPEQAFITFSSVCFATLVKFVSDYLRRARAGTSTAEESALYSRCVEHLSEVPSTTGQLADGPFDGEDTVLEAMCEAGRRVVQHRLVDSYFGNISCLHDQVIYISQTASSMDELEGCIDACPLNGSRTTGITASSELIAHRRVYELTGVRTILHGHPELSVILSLDCLEVAGCEDPSRCHLDCPATRQVAGVPIVPGEVGAGPRGLCHTLPEAVASTGAAIVYGHGLFTTGAVGFDEPLSEMLRIERACLDELVRRAPPG